MRIFAIGTYAYMVHAQDSKSIVLATFLWIVKTDIDPSPDTGSSPDPKKTRKSKHEAKASSPLERSVDFDVDRDWRDLAKVRAWIQRSSRGRSTEYLKRFIRSVCKERHGEASFTNASKEMRRWIKRCQFKFPVSTLKVCVDLGVHEPGG